MELLSTFSYGKVRLHAIFMIFSLQQPRAACLTALRSWLTKFCTRFQHTKHTQTAVYTATWCRQAAWLRIPPALIKQTLHFAQTACFVFCAILTRNNDYLHKQHKVDGLRNGDGVLFFHNVATAIAINFWLQRDDPWQQVRSHSTSPCIES